MATCEDLIEIQSLDVIEVASGRVEDAYAKLQSPVLVDDTGLVLSAGNGLPGVPGRRVPPSVGVQGILDLATSIKIAAP